MQFIWMNRHAKNMLSSWDGIYNNNNVCNVLYLSYMINTTSNSKEFSFSRYYIYCMMNNFGNNFLSSINIQDQSSNVVFNTGIRNNKYCILINEWILIDATEFVMMSNFCIGVFSVNWMKRKTIKKSVYQTKARRNFSI